MQKTLTLASLLVFVQISVVTAAPISISGLSGNFTPGTPIAFEVGLPPISNLGSYNIDLLLSSTVGVAGTDYFFDVAATGPAAAGYVFPSATNYFGAANVDSPSIHRLTLTDFDLLGQDVLAGLNDRVAVVTIGTVANFQGELALSFDTAGLILDTPDVFPTPVQGFDQIVSDTAAQDTITLSVVPEPTSHALFSIGMILFTARGVAKRSVVVGSASCGDRH